MDSKKVIMDRFQKKAMPKRDEKCDLTWNYACRCRRRSSSSKKDFSRCHDACAKLQNWSRGSRLEIVIDRIVILFKNATRHIGCVFVIIKEFCNCFFCVLSLGILLFDH
jgi:hypothetical protein